MIELNLTYEESKKILELGYDFSKICDFVWVTMDANETPVLGCQNLEIQHLLFTQKIYDFQTALIQKQPIEIIPIIPKAALEACLPDLEEEKSIANARVWLGKDLYAIQEDCIYSLDSDGLGYGSYDLERLKDQEFNSAFEAFSWCHENYPEELKKKFDEVMK